MVIIIPQHGSVLDPLRGMESKLPQNPAAFNTPFFSRITIEKLIRTLNTYTTGSFKKEFLNAPAIAGTLLPPWLTKRL